MLQSGGLLASLDQPFYRNEHLFSHLRYQVVMLDGELLRLTRMQYRVLALLVEDAGKVVPRASILAQI
jgi:DNA-binding response OmpR family regulator